MLLSNIFTQPLQLPTKAWKMLHLDVGFGEHVNRCGLLRRRLRRFCRLDLLRRRPPFLRWLIALGCWSGGYCRLCAACGRLSWPLMCTVGMAVCICHLSSCWRCR